jgi:hypothetical protein
MILLRKGLTVNDFAPLCEEFGVDAKTNRFVLFSALYEQFSEFAVCKKLRIRKTSIPSQNHRK